MRQLEIYEVRARMAEEDAGRTPAELAEKRGAEQAVLEAEGWRLVRRGNRQPAA